MAINTVKVTGYANGPLFAVVHLRALTGESMTADDIQSITYSVYDCGRSGSDKFEPVEGHENVTLDLSVVMKTLGEVTYVRDGEAVTMERNFEHSIDISTHPAFPTRGHRYIVRYNISPVNGHVSPIQIYVEAN